MGACISTPGEQLLPAAERGDVHLVRAVLQAHPNAVNSSDANGSSALALAARHGHEACVKELLARGADVAAVDKDGVTPLHEAVTGGHAKCVQALLGRGAPLEARTAYGSTPLFLAAANARGECSPGCLRALLAAGAQVNARNQGMFTPLHRAAHFGQLEAIQLLAAAGADLGARDVNGQTPRDIATARGCREAALLLAQLAKQQAALASAGGRSSAAAGTAAAASAPSAPVPSAPALPPTPPAASAAAQQSLTSTPSAPIAPAGLLERASPLSSGGSAQLSGRGSSSLSSDPLLLYVQAQLASLAQHPQQQGAAGGGGGAPDALRSWELGFQELELVGLLGEGSFGKVFLAHWQQTPVAVKVLLRGPQSSEALSLSHPALAGLHREASLMAGLRHPNVVSLLGVCATPATIVTEFCERGSLSDVLQRASCDPAAAAELPWPRRLALAIDAAQGMLYLHNRGVVHRDLKSPNLLVGEGWRVKVSDFNLSKVAEAGSRKTTALDLNPRWLAPEVLQGGRHTPASDVYSFGVILWELLTWRLPWDTAALAWQIAANVVSGGRLEVPPAASLPGVDMAQFAAAGCLDSYMALMAACWAQSPGGRPSFADVIPQLRSLAETYAAHGAGAASAAADAPTHAALRECRICMAEGGELMVLVPCGHRAACEQCTAKLLGGEGRHTCPVCRAEIETAVSSAFRIFSC